MVFNHGYIYCDTTMLIINPKGTTTKLYPMKLTIGTSDLVNRYIPKKQDAKYPINNTQMFTDMIASTGIVLTITQFTPNPQHSTRPITRL